MYLLCEMEGPALLWLSPDEIIYGCERRLALNDTLIGVILDHREPILESLDDYDYWRRRPRHWRFRARRESH